MAALPIDEFPVWGLMPKKETGVVSFLTKHENYDGRDTIIAIFDSGVDPAADGLKLTSTGETKVIERFDCSGCGDVDTSTIKKIADGYITGITGRKLKIPDSWNNPSGEWRVGILHPFTLYPTKVKERMQEHRKECYWDVKHKPAFAEANKKLQEFENEVSSKSNLSIEEKQQKEELEARVEVLQLAEKKYNDVGPTYDCVLFNDGAVWRACIDTSETGDLSSGVFLGEYSATHEHSHLTKMDEMTVSINVHDEGNTLEVVGMCSTHGTHVAAIASGYFPSEPERNGVAPGAKIVSLTIGDSRLGSMETGTALVRACIKVMELSKQMKIDVINMSYGEHAHWANSGRVGDIIASVVNRYGVSWVVSAGNHGPALGTVGAPPDIAQPVLVGVGAYVSPEMMSAAYSMRCKLGGGAFSWSSRGPTADGALGVAVCAPGGAVAAVARFTLRNSQLMNGTSMAAPHVAGAVASLISGLKARQLPYSPYSIKRSLENSATYLEHVEPWAQGAGLLNIEKAFDLLSTYHDAPERDVTFNLSCGSGNKGVLLKPRPPHSPKDISLTVDPQFLTDHKDEHNTGLAARQIAFGVRLALVARPAAAWLHAPAHLDMMNASRPISIRVDTAALPPGPHFTSLNAYDVSCVDKGPVFRIPITVFQSEPLPESGPAVLQHNVLFKPDTIKRHFIIPPPNATWGVVRLRTGGAGGAGGAGAGRFLLHCMQLVPRRSCRKHETQKMVSVARDAAAVLPFPVVGDVPLEIVIAKYWANIGELHVDYKVELHGVRADCGPRLTLPAADGLCRVALVAARAADLQPAATLKYHEPAVKPTESKITPLTSRDVLPPSRQIYALVNSYSFHIAKATDVSPAVSLLCDMLYESEFESQMWMLYNSCKQLMAVGDAYPSKYSVKLEKGDYVLRLNIRHENKAYLEKLQELPVIIQQRLQTPINLDAYCSHAQALTGGKKFSSVTLNTGTVLPIYFAPIPNDKVSRLGSSPLVLTGTVTFPKDELARRADGTPLVYLCGEAARRAASPRDARDYADAAREFAAAWLPKLEGEKLEQVYEETLEKFPGFLGAHIAYLQGIDSHTDPKKLPHVNEEPDATTAWCEQLITISETVIKAIDQDKLLAYLGMKNDTRSDATKIKQEQEKSRTQLIEAISRRGVCLCRLAALSRSTAEPAGAALSRSSAEPAGAALLSKLQENMQDLLKYTDLTDTKAIHYGVWHSFTVKQWGKAIKLLNKMQEEKPSKEVEERLIQVYKELKWEHLADFTTKTLPIKFPAGYRPF